MPLPKRGPGRPPGSPNKITGEIRQALREAFTEVGGKAALVKLHKNNPEAFFALIGKLIPTEVVGAEGREVLIRVITGVPQPDSDLDSL